MSDFVVRLGQRAIAVSLPAALLEGGIFANLGNGSSTSSVDRRIIVSQAADRSFVIDIDGGRQEAGLTRGAALTRLLDYLAAGFAETAQVPVIAAAAVGWGDGAVLIAGPEACGKSSLAAWFVEKGFTLIADRQIAVTDGVDLLAGYRTPFAFRASGADHLMQLADIATAPMIRTGDIHPSLPIRYLQARPWLRRTRERNRHGSRESRLTPPRLMR